MPIAAFMDGDPGVVHAVETIQATFSKQNPGLLAKAYAIWQARKLVSGAQGCEVGWGKGGAWLAGEERGVAVGRHAMRHDPIQAAVVLGAMLVTGPRALGQGPSPRVRARPAMPPLLAGPAADEHGSVQGG